MIWPGFGVNYNANITHWNDDIAYFNKIGLRNIRPTMPSWDNQLDVDRVENMAITFKNAGFFVTWGISSQLITGYLTAAKWQSYHDAVVAEAARLQSMGVILDEFETGNELSNAIDNTTLTLSQLYTKLQQLALDVKAVYSGVVSYAIAGGEYTAWLANGLGNYDTMSFHVYSQVSPNQSIDYNFHNVQQIAPTMAKFGDKATITEFNLDSDYKHLYYLPYNVQAKYMQTFFWDYIVASGVEKAYIFQWSGGNSASNNWAAGMLTNGTLNPMWYSFFSSNPIPYTPRALKPGRNTTNNRTVVSGRTTTPNRASVLA